MNKYPYGHVGTGTINNPLKMQKGDKPLPLPSGTKIVLVNVTNRDHVEILKSVTPDGKTLVTFLRK